jgi:hypothetical protein
MREVENMIAEAERENDEATIESVMQEFQMLSQEFREMGEGI